MTSRLRASTAACLALTAALFGASPVQAFPVFPGTPGQNCAAGYMADRDQKGGAYGSLDVRAKF